MIEKNALPELLAPAGSLAALEAAIDGGADAVYFGSTDFNARLRAENFTDDTLRDAISLCHAFGVRAYITMNTLVTDKELPAFLSAAQKAWEAGADALIVADLGAAAALRRALPEVVLHASTQCSGHSSSAAQQLKKIGFSRMVLARETPSPDIRRFLLESGMEGEVFVHGALCVSHSGQCLFSSLVGGRSGNRGECAQPCRLPDREGRYPLSLKDLSLARHIPELIDMGVDSLKLEGRLKSPAYVFTVTSIFRRLLDGRRGANDREMAELNAAFSRGGFTDGYFTGRVDSRMLGVRSEGDKKQTEALAAYGGLRRTLPLSLHLTMQKDIPLTLTAKVKDRHVTVYDEPPLVAINAPMDEEAVKKSLCKLGGTPFVADTVTILLDKGLMVPVSRLNALRRKALAALSSPQRATKKPTPLPAPFSKNTQERVNIRSARFENAAQITKAAKDYFPLRFLPLHAYTPEANGVILPPVIFDSEREAVAAALKNAKAAGAEHALVSGVGHLDLALEAGLIPHGDFRLNATNDDSVKTLCALGFTDVLLSPELTLPQIRDITGRVDAIVYGRIPLMLLEKCAGKEAGSCTACEAGKNALIDRRGERFPILRLPPHRNILVNSRPTAMSDKGADLRRAKITAGHFIFTVETPAEVDGVIAAYQNGTPLSGAVRRI